MPQQQPIKIQEIPEYNSDIDSLQTFGRIFSEKDEFGIISTETIRYLVFCI